MKAKMSSNVQLPDSMAGVVHEWVPFTEDIAICIKCGDTCDEAAPEDEWNAETCELDDLLTGGK